MRRPLAIKINIVSNLTVSSVTSPNPDFSSIPNTNEAKRTITVTLSPAPIIVRNGLFPISLVISFVARENIIYDNPVPRKNCINTVIISNIILTAKYHIMITTSISITTFQNVISNKLLPGIKIFIKSK